MGTDLGIPDKNWDPSRPDTSVGWCAEACIQMAMEFYGGKISQKKINLAGKPEHSDLYMDDIDTALKNLHVTYEQWDQSNHDIDQYINWIISKLDKKCPVICGVKIYPDKNPQWFLDHFVLIIGYNEHSLLVNTNIYGKKKITFSKLKSKNSGISFYNRHLTYFARAITGIY